ncbi:MAG: QueT transporter family protein [Candidatus Lernaella stagnicola]|nr:QueT transporter family protein [Candidatus Lernaella stagnicola]
MQKFTGLFAISTAALALAFVLVAILRRFLLRRPLDVFSMWRETRMVVYAAVTAALYFALLVPFKWAVLVPGLTEIRPGAAAPLALSFLLGPAAAWGAAIGNFIGDFFGMFGPGSLVGFVGNFLLAYAPYAIYRAWIGHRSPIGIGWRGPFVAAVGIIAGSLACGTFIGWGAHLIGLAPFRVLAPVIVINNVIVGLVLALPLVLLLYPRAAAWGVTYYEIMDEKDAAPAPTAKLGSVIFIVAALTGLITGVALQSFLGVDATAPWVLGLAVSPSILAMFVGLLLL